MTSSTPVDLIRRTIHDLTRPLLLKQFAWVALFWVFVAVSILLNIEYLKTNYPDAVRPDDRILDLIEESATFIFVGELFSTIEVILVVGIFWTRGFRGAPYLLFLLGTMFIIRGFVITLTPLAQIQPPAENYPEDHIIAQLFYHGMYFSGHTASAFIQAFYFKGHRLRPLIFLVAAIQAFALLASHSHYTIDVVGGFFVAYFVVHVEWIRFVPPPLKNVRWMPWYVEGEQNSAIQREAPALQ